MEGMYSTCKNDCQYEHGRSRYCNTCINLIDVPVPSFTCILILLLIFLIKITFNFYNKETVCIVDFEGFFEMNS